MDITIDSDHPFVTMNKQKNQKEKSYYQQSPFQHFTRGHPLPAPPITATTEPSTNHQGAH